MKIARFRLPVKPHRVSAICPGQRSGSQSACQAQRDTPGILKIAIGNFAVAGCLLSPVAHGGRGLAIGGNAQVQGHTFVFYM